MSYSAFEFSDSLARSDPQFYLTNHNIPAIIKSIIILTGIFMYIKRDLEKKIKKYLYAPEIIAVVGARQVGKTTLLKHIQKDIENSTFITLEDAQIRALFNRDINSFI